MSSVVFYRFRSQKEPSRVAFDGTGISVWDLKKEIIMENKMGKGGDFDFAIYNADTEEEYADDRFIVPRSTSVLARRLPPSKAGRGNAQKYMATGAEAVTGPAGRPDYHGPGGGAGRGGGGGGGAGGWSAGSFSKRFDGRDDAVKPPSQEPVQIPLPAAAPDDEAGALAAMFAASSQQWQQTQEQMATATPVYRAPIRPARPAAPPRDGSAPAPGGSAPGGPPADGARAPFRPSSNAPESHKPPPLGYICYRCGQKGHWIQECPTNADRAYDDRPRIKRTTGIPKSFLTAVEGPGGSTNADPTSSGVMVTAEGGFVVARPDNASWLAHRAITKNLTANDIQNLAPTDPDLTCPICSKLLREATLTPCCSTSFCSECIHNHLDDNDMLCADCETRIKNVNKLVDDVGRRERVKKYIEEMVEASKEQEEEVVELDEVKQDEGAAEGENKSEEKDKENEASPAVEGAKPVEPTKVGEEELFPVKPEEPFVPVPRPSLSPTAIRTSHAPAAPGVVPAPPPPLNAAQQAQAIRQQQLRAQQAMAMQMGMQMGLPMGMTPQMLQQQIFQINMTLQNPQLPPPMRMNLQAQLQQFQMIAMRMGLIAAPPGFNNNMAAPGYGGNFGPAATSAGVPARGRSATPAGATSPIPTGPRAEVNGQPVAAVGGEKRTRTDSGEEEGEQPSSKRHVSGEVPAQSE